MQTAVLAALAVVGRMFGPVGMRRGHAGQCPPGLDQCTHRHQHAAHVGVVDDRHRSRRAGDVATLHALLRIGHGLLVRTLGHGHALHADGEARGVHHHEHVFEAAIFLADAPADRAGADLALVLAVEQDAGRAGGDTKLVFERGAPDVVAPARAAVPLATCLATHPAGAVVRSFATDVFRHGEERDALDAFGRIRRAREHEMQDVLCQIVFAPGDEDLLSRDTIAAVRLRDRLRAHERQVGTRLWLGQVHRAGPLAADQLRDVARLLLRRAGDEQRLDGAVGQQRAQCQRQIGRVEHFPARCRQYARQTLATETLRMLHALPAAIDEAAEGVGKTRRRRHLAVGQHGRLQITGAVQRRNHAFIEFRAFVEHGGGRVDVETLVRRQRSEFVDAGQLAQHEEHVRDGRAIRGGTR